MVQRRGVALIMSATKNEIVIVIIGVETITDAMGGEAFSGVFTSIPAVVGKFGGGRIAKGRLGLAWM